MALSLIVDGLDLSTYIRLAPGEGVDPADGDMLDFGLTENSGLEGPSLLSETAGAREMTWPMHVTPTKSGGVYASTKQGLHDQIRDINAKLANAKGKRLQWQDDGATNATHFDIIAARFEFDYNYRRQQKMWASGVLRVWARPYGHTGTFRNIGTALATGVGVAVNVLSGSVNGDVMAHMAATVTAGSFAIGDARITGIAVVPSGYQWSFSAASDINAEVAFGASGDAYNAGSVSVKLGDDNLPLMSEISLANLQIIPASMYVGRNRILGLVGGIGVIRAYNADNELLGEGNASVATLRGLNVVDLGVLDVAPIENNAPFTNEEPLWISFTAELPSTLWPFDRPFAWQGSFQGPRLNHILMFPDDGLALNVDDRRTCLANHAFIWGNDPSGATVLPDVDDLGNEISLIGPDPFAVGLSASLYHAAEGLRMSNLGAVNTLRGAYFEVDHPVNNIQLDVEMAFRFNSGVINASQAVTLGVGGTTNGYLQSRVVIHKNNGSQAVLTVFDNGGGIESSRALGNVPSMGVLQAKFFNNEGLLLVDARVRTMEGSVLGVASGVTVMALTTEMGKARFGVHSIPSAAAAGALTTTSPDICGIRITGNVDQEQLLRQPRDIFTFSSATQGALHGDQFTFQRDLTSRMRGVIPGVAPTIPQRVVGIYLPTDGDQKNTDRTDVCVGVLERWRYAR